MNIQRFAQKAVVVNGNDEILLIRYGSSIYFDDKLTGRYALPGGKVGFGESVDESLIKEIQEETGIICIPGRPLHVWNWEYQKGEDLIQINAVMRECDYESGTIRSFTQEHETTIDQVQWIHKDSILDLPFVEDELPGIHLYLQPLIT